MLRSSRPLLAASAYVRGLARSAAPIGPSATSHTQRSASSAAWRARAPTTVSAKQLVPYIQQARYASKTERDVAFEKEVAKKKLESDPEHVTSESSVRHFEGPGERVVQGSTTDGLKQDLVSCMALSFSIIQIALTPPESGPPSRSTRTEQRSSAILPAGPLGHNPVPRDFSCNRILQLGHERRVALSVAVSEPLHDQS